MIGSSYEGFTVLMALVPPHPALKAASPEGPRGDGRRGGGKPVARTGYDDYDNFRRAGSAGDFARASGFDQIGFWRKLSEHPAYDAWWQGQALDKLLAAEPLTVPTLIVAALWDQEDIYGGVTTYQALEPKDKANDRLFLALGPWRHSGQGADGSVLGPLRFDGDPALAFRRDIARPFFEAYLRDRPGKPTIAPATVYETGTNTWRKLPRWPLACASGCPSPLRPLYLQPGGRARVPAPPRPGPHTRPPATRAWSPPGPPPPPPPRADAPPRSR